MKNEKIVPIFNQFLRSKILLGFVIFIFALKLCTSLIFINFPINIFFADITKSNLVNLLNQSRQSYGLNTLTENGQLDEAAELKARDMVNNGYFNHVSPNGTTPWYWFSLAGYNYKYAGENLAIGFYDSQDVYNAWLNSLSHKENMLNPVYKEVGTAILTGFGSNDAIVVVQLFGTPKTNTVVTTATNEATQAITPSAEKTEIITESSPESISETNVGIKTETKNTETSLDKKVLSSSIVIEADKGDYRNDLYSKFLNFVTYEYNIFLEYIIYGLVTTIMLMSVYIMSLNFKNNVDNGLLLRSLILITILSSSLLVDNNLIILLLPHQITI